jgi:hypothetical protein
MRKAVKSVLLDNRSQRRVGEVLQRNIQKDARLSVIFSVFSIYGYAALKQELARLGQLRLLIPTGDGNPADDEHVFSVPGLTSCEFDRCFRNTLNITQIACECAQRQWPFMAALGLYGLIVARS